MTQQIDRLLSQLYQRLDAAAIVTGDAIDPRYGDDLSGKGGGRPELVLRPRSAAEVAEILRLCSGIGQKLVIHGGRTGLAGAARVQPGEAVLSLERMTALEAPDRAAATIIAEAGAPLQMVQEAADAAGLMFGVDIGARGTATVGGNIATNAGGIRVLRYGMYRAQVLGLEAVLADGSILTSLRGLAKDNSGYDLNQLFIGSEGTLGVVTRACLRLHPKPATEVAAFCALGSLEAAIALLGLLKQRLGPLLSAYEVNFSPLYGAMIAGMAAPAPLPAGAPVYVLAEIQGNQAELDGERFASVLMQAVEDGIVDDVVVSQSPREFRALWDVREEANRFLFAIHGLIGVDISIPLATMAAFPARRRSGDPRCRQQRRDLRLRPSRRRQSALSGRHQGTGGGLRDHLSRRGRVRRRRLGRTRHRPRQEEMAEPRAQRRRNISHAPAEGGLRSAQHPQSRARLRYRLIVRRI